MHINNIKLLGLVQYKDDISISSIHVGNNQIDAWVELNHPTLCTCPKCNRKTVTKIKNHYETTVTHCNDKYRPIYLHINKKQYVCQLCHKTFMERNPLVYDAFPGITSLSVLSVLEELQNTNHSFTEIAKSHYVYPKLIKSIFDAFVDFDLGKPTNAICIDEKCYVHGDTKFALCILDFNTNKLIDLCKDRKKVTLLNWLRKVRDAYVKPPEDKSLDTSSGNNQGAARTLEIKYFCIDMSQYYYDAIKQVFPYAIVAVDSFHVIRNVMDALQEVRIKVLNKYYSKEKCFNQNTGELLPEEISDTKQSIEYRVIKKYRNLLFLNRDLIRIPAEQKKYNILISQYADSVDVLDYVLAIDDTLRLAWQLKELYCYFNRHATYDNAEPWLTEIINEFMESRISSFVKLAKTLNHWKQPIVNSFILVNGRRLSNGPMEGMNHNIQNIIINGNGLSDFETLRKRALLRYGTNNSYRITPIKKK